MSLYLVRLIEPVFQSIEDRISGFLKQFFDCFKNIFFKKVFQLFFSLRLGKAALHIFCHFLPQFLQGFPPSRPVRPFYPSFWFYFHVFMHIFMHLGDIFGTFDFWDFWWFKACFLKLIIGILLYSWLVLINLINLGFYEKLKFLGFMLESDLGILFNWVEIDEIGLLFWCNWSFWLVF